MGELALVGDHSTVPLTRVSCNTVFSKSQNPHKAGTLCIMKLQFSINCMVSVHRKKKGFEGKIFSKRFYHNFDMEKQVSSVYEEKKEFKRKMCAIFSYSKW